MFLRDIREKKKKNRAGARESGPICFHRYPLLVHSKDFYLKLKKKPLHSAGTESLYAIKYLRDRLKKYSFTHFVFVKKRKIKNAFQKFLLRKKKKKKNVEFLLYIRQRILTE